MYIPMVQLMVLIMRHRLSHGSTATFAPRTQPRKSNQGNSVARRTAYDHPTSGVIAPGEDFGVYSKHWNTFETDGVCMDRPHYELDAMYFGLPSSATHCEGW